MSYVYFARAMATPAYKIGRSVDPHRRIRQLQIGCHIPICIVQTLGPTPHAALIESLLHRRYAPVNIRGEWFMLDPMDITYEYTEYTTGRYPVLPYRPYWEGRIEMADWRKNDPSSGKRPGIGASGK